MLTTSSDSPDTKMGK